MTVRLAVDKPHIQRAQKYDHDDGWICYGGPIPEFDRSEDATLAERMRRAHGGIGVGETIRDAWRAWCATNFGD